jgi:hypothetical protein
VTHLVRNRRPVLRAVALALVLVALPLPALAQDAKRPAATPSLRASAEKAAATATLAPSAAPKAAAQDKAQLGSTSFFKSPAGIAVIAVVAAGTGYAFYSASHDRIHSAVRTGQQ